METFLYESTAWIFFLHSGNEKCARWRNSSISNYWMVPMKYEANPARLAVFWAVKQDHGFCFRLTHALSDSESNNFCYTFAMIVYVRKWILKLLLSKSDLLTGLLTEKSAQLLAVKVTPCGHFYSSCNTKFPWTRLKIQLYKNSITVSHPSSILFQLHESF